MRGDGVMGRLRARFVGGLMILYLMSLLCFVVSAMAVGVGDYVTALVMLCTVGICLAAYEVTK